MSNLFGLNKDHMTMIFKVPLVRIEAPFVEFLNKRLLAGLLVLCSYGTTSKKLDVLTGKHT